MKIYIPDYSVTNLFNKIQQFDGYLIKTRKYNFIFSDEGVFRVDAKSIKQLFANDGNVISIKKSADAYKKDLLIDTSTVTEVDVERLPCHHVSLPVQLFWFSINTKSKLRMILEGSYTDYGSLKYDGFIPTDFYLEAPDDYDFKVPTNIDDINMFLSMFN